MTLVATTNGQSKNEQRSRWTVLVADRHSYAALDWSTLSDLSPVTLFALVQCCFNCVKDVGATPAHI